MTSRDRWRMLAILFAVRAGMAFQFQSVAAVAPMLAELGIALADIGLLIGLYLLPGVLLALPGGAIGRRFGAKRTVFCGLMLMICGGAIMAFAQSWTAQLGGRLLAGIGGVLLNVLMSKMATDWFGEADTATAMAIFVNSWPAGIAVALVTLPLIGAAYGVAAAFAAPAVLLAIGAVLLGKYQDPPSRGTPALGRGWPDRTERRAVILAGITWGLFNVGFAIIFSFGPSMLAERALSPAAAGSIVSIVLWLALASIPLGGVLADRSGRPDGVLALGCVASGLLMLLAPQHPSIATFVALGVFGGLPAGAIMALPARALAPSALATGMGIFYTVFYIGMAVGPAIGGWIATAANSADAAFTFGALTLFGCLPTLWLFRRQAAATPQKGVEARLP
jgi:predicted MFS family arabinose efflux permease